MFAAVLAVASAVCQDFVWLTSFDQAKTLAKQSRHPIMLYFTTEWCGWCKVMEKETFTAPSVIKRSKDYLSVKLDAEKDGKALAQKYKISSFPTFVFVNSEGTEVGRIVGYCQAEPFNTKTSAILSSPLERKALVALLAKEPTNCAALCKLANIELADGNLEEARKHLDAARSAGHKGTEMAALLSQVGFEIGMTNPPLAVTYLQESINLKDQGTLSLSYERLINLAAMGGNKELMVATARALLTERDVNPSLAKRAERVAKGSEQDERLTTAEDLVKELQAQLKFQRPEERDVFYFRNLFLDGASVTVVANLGGSIGRFLVDQETFVANLGIDKLKTTWEFEAPIISTHGALSNVSLSYQSRSETADGKKLEAKGTMLLLLCQQGNRWFITGLAMQAT